MAQGIDLLEYEVRIKVRAENPKVAVDCAANMLNAGAQADLVLEVISDDGTDASYHDVTALAGGA